MPYVNWPATFLAINKPARPSASPFSQCFPSQMLRQTFTAQVRTLISRAFLTSVLTVTRAPCATSTSRYGNRLASKTSALVYEYTQLYRKIPVSLSRLTGKTAKCT